MLETFRRGLRLFRRRTVLVDPYEAYQRWAVNYDERENNALLFAEEQILHPLLAKLSLRGKRILDAGCGTGRYFPHLLSLHPKLINGVDFSENMIARAAEKFVSIPTVSVQRGDIASIPFKNSTFNLVLSTLALDHAKDIATPIAEFARVLRRNATLIISVFHPYGGMLGWERTFTTTVHEGRTLAVRYYPHLHAEYFRAFCLAGLRLVDMFEPVLDESLEHFYQKAHRPDLFKRYRGIPLLLIFHLKKG